MIQTFCYHGNVTLHFSLSIQERVQYKLKEQRRQLRTLLRRLVCWSSWSCGNCFWYHCRFRWRYIWQKKLFPVVWVLISYFLIVLPSPSLCVLVRTDIAICSRKRHFETSRREEQMGRVIIINNNGIYIALIHRCSKRVKTVIKSKMAATTTLRTRTRFRPPKKG